MRSKTLVLATALVLCSGSISWAQSSPNFGPNAPTRGDTYGKPPSGTYRPPSGAKAHAYRSHNYAMLKRHNYARLHHPHHHHHHRTHTKT